MARKMRELISPSALKKRGSGKVKSERKKTLIVCEGTETEPTYFKDMVKDLKIANTDVYIEPGRHSNPSSVVRTAIDLYEQDLEFELIYCLIDTDEFGKDIDLASSMLKEHTFSRRKKSLGGDRYPQAKILRSDPCIEVWFLLHYEVLRRPFVKANKSAAQNCKEYLKNTHLKDYSEKYNGLYSLIKKNGLKACEESARLRAWLEKNDCINPFTQIDELYLDLHEKVFAPAKR